MKNYFLILLFICISFISCADQNIDKNIFNILSGDWQLNPLANKSQGATLIIDLNGRKTGSSNSHIIGPIRGSDIVAVKKITDKKYLITILFVDKNKYDFIINMNDNGTIWFEKMDWFNKIQYLSEYGPEHPYYKVSGPENKDNPYYKPIVDNLRLRATPNSNAIIYRILERGEKLNLLRKGKQEIINNVKGTWVQVRTDNGEIGWCFDAFLEEVK
jgi:hypothetical protein